MTRHHVGEYLLTGGMARCGLCDAALISRPNGKKERCYVCATGVGLHGCGKIRRLADPVEALVRDALFATVDSPEFAAKVKAASKGDGSKAARETADGIRAKLTRLTDEWARDEITDAEWRAARETLTSRLTDAEAVLRL